MKDKQEVIKHSSAIQIENAITLLQRRAWNILLANAYDELLTEEIHAIVLKKLAEALGYTSRNEIHLKDTLKALMSTLLEWNVIGKDRSHTWGAATLLSEVEIENGICTYAFSPRLRRRLYNPKMYARISLSIQNQFSSKYALALYELFVDYLHPDRTHGETPFIPVSDFRRLMGLSEDVYREFKKLNKWVIKDPVAEINKITDLHVTPTYKKQGKRITAIKFNFQRQLQIPLAPSQQPSLLPEFDDMPPIVSTLCDAGLTTHDAWDVWQKGVDYIEADDKPTPEAFESYLQEKIDLLKHRQQAGKVESATGFLLSAIRYNYAPGKTVKTVSKRRQAKRTQAKVERQAELRERFAEHREQVFWRRFEERPEAWRSEQRQHFEAMLQGDPTHRFVWQSYREHGSLQSPSIAGVFMQMLADELLVQPEETSLEAFVAWVDKAT